MEAEGLARESTGRHGLLLRVGERLRDLLRGAAQRTTGIRMDIALVHRLLSTQNVNLRCQEL